MNWDTLKKKEELVVHADDLKKVREPLKVKRPKPDPESKSQKRIIFVPQAARETKDAAPTGTQTPEGEQHHYGLRPRKKINYKM